ncbi:MAG: BTAD domain-containing putative transcriptional regulator [Gemmatimonadales bacterium]
MAAPTRITLSLFGSVQLVDADGRAAERVLAQPKLVGLLAYLAVPSVGQFRRRDTVVAALWPELDQTHARAALRKAVHTLRSTLGPEAVQSRGDEDVGLPADRFWCDVAAFTEAAESAQLSQALELYRGDLMPGFHLAECAEYDQWLEEERAAARERAAAAAWALAQRFEGDDQLSAAAQWARKAVRFSWSDERALRRALGMLDRLHDRAGALRLYEEFARRLRSDLDVEPSAETVALADRIRGSSKGAS